MPNGHAETLAAVISFLDRSTLQHQESEGPQYYTRVDVQSGKLYASLDVYKSGKMVVGGPKSTLRDLLQSLKEAIDSGDSVPGQNLPWEIERFPDTLRERISDIDPVIVDFVAEAIKCYRAGALLGAAFMIGAASERAINLLIKTYAESIIDEGNKSGFVSRLGGKYISRQYDEFLKSYKSCKSRPTEGILAHDIEVVIGGMFQFYRLTRNDVGHPEIVPDLDKGVILANLGQLVTYMERIYGLMDHFRSNGVVV